MAHGLAAVVAGGQAHRKRTGSRAPPRRSRRAGPGRLAAAVWRAARRCSAAAAATARRTPRRTPSSPDARHCSRGCRPGRAAAAAWRCGARRRRHASHRRRPPRNAVRGALCSPRRRGWRADLHHGLAGCPATPASASSHIPSSSARKSCYEGARTLRDPQSFFFEQGTGTGGTIILLALRVIR